jgi:hypothetical protein
MASKREKKILRKKQRYLELLQKATRNIDKAAMMIVKLGTPTNERRVTLEELNEARRLAAKALNRLPYAFK